MPSGMFGGSGGGYDPNQYINPQNWQVQQAGQGRPAQFNYQSAGFDPNNPWGQTNFNPMTGDVNRQGPTGTIIGGGRGTSDGMFASYLDSDGNRVLNPGAFNSQFGVQAGGGPVDPYSVTPYAGGQYQAGAAWDPNLVNAGNVIDTNAVIESFRPRMEEEIAQGFADAGNRMGQSGFAMSTPYAEALGGVERKALSDYANTALQYQYAAAEAQAQREMQAQQQNSAQDLGAWQTQSGYGHAGQMGDLGREFGGWQAGEQMGLNAWNSANQTNLGWGQLDMQAQIANQNNQQQWMQMLMSGML